MKEQTLEIVKGTSKDYRLTFQDSAGGAKDITGWTVFFTVKRTMESADETDADALLLKTVTAHTDPTNGITVVPVSASDANLPLGLYFYDIKVRTDSGRIFTVIRGKFLIVWRVTGRIV